MTRVSNNDSKTQEPIAVFDAPSFVVLVAHWRKLRRCHRIILHTHINARYPAILLRVFAKTTECITGRSLEITPMYQSQQVQFSKAAIDLSHSDEDDGQTFVLWMMKAIGLPEDLAIRYHRRVSLERAFTRLAAETTASHLKNAGSIVYLSVSNWPTEHFPSANIEMITAPKVFSQLGAALLLFIAFQARFFREIFALKWCLSLPRMETVPLVSYEMGYQHNNLTTDEELGIRRKSFSTMPYLIDPSASGIFISDIWRAKQGHIDAYSKAMRDDGYRVFDWATFRLQPKRMLSLFYQTWRAIVLGILYLRHWHQAFDAARFLGLLAREQIIFDNLPAKTIVCFDDYSERSIVRTFVAHKFDAKTVGIQHSANDGYRSSSELCTTYFNHYMTANQFVRDKFQAYWPSEMVEPFGVARLDSFTHELRSSSRAIYKSLPNSAKPIILFTLPVFTSREHFLANKPNGDEFIHLIRSAIKMYGNDLNIVLRPKGMNNLDEIADVFGCPPAQIAADLDVATPQLCKAADLVICSAGSTLMSECSILKTRFILFDFSNSPTTIYDEFGSMFFNASNDDIDRALQKISALEPLDVDYNLVFETFNSDSGVNRRDKLSQIANQA